MFWLCLGMFVCWTHLYALHFTLWDVTAILSYIIAIHLGASFIWRNFSVQLQRGWWDDFGGRIIAAMLGRSQDMCWCPRIYWFKWFESFLKKKISKNYFFIMPLKINNVASHAFLFGFHKEWHMALPLLPAPRSVLCFWLLELDSSNGCNVQLIAGWRRSTLFLDEFDCCRRESMLRPSMLPKKSNSVEVVFAGGNVFHMVLQGGWVKNEHLIERTAIAWRRVDANA